MEIIYAGSKDLLLIGLSKKTGLTKKITILPKKTINGKKLLTRT